MVDGTELRTGRGPGTGVAVQGKRSWEEVGSGRPPPWRPGTGETPVPHRTAQRAVAHGTEQWHTAVAAAPRGGRRMAHLCAAKMGHRRREITAVGTAQRAVAHGYRRREIARGSHCSKSTGTRRTATSPKRKRAGGVQDVHAVRTARRAVAHGERVQGGWMRAWTARETDESVPFKREV